MWPLRTPNAAPAAGNLWSTGERNISNTADVGICCMETSRAAGDHVTVATVTQPSEACIYQKQAPRRHADVESGAACSTTLRTTLLESAAEAGIVVRENPAMLRASTGVRATTRRGDVTPEGGAGAAESENHGSGELAALAAPAEKHRRSTCAFKDHILSKATPVTGRTEKANRCLLYDLVVETGGQESVSLLVPHVEASEGIRPCDPRTRSVDVQQQRRYFQDPPRVATNCSLPTCEPHCEYLSSCSVRPGGRTLPFSVNTRQATQTSNCEGSGSTEQNIKRAEAVACESDGRRAEHYSADGVKKLIPASHVTEFKDLALDAALLQNLRVLGFRIPSPVQCALIPRALKGKNLIVQAKSGTGKTLAFALYLLQALTQRFKQRVAHLAASADRALHKTASPCVGACGVSGSDGRCLFSDRDVSAAEKAQQPLYTSASTYEPLCSSAAADADCIAMALVLTPTRELTIQVANEISRLGWRMQHPRLRHACFFGGRPLSVCHQQLAQKPHVLISTPGRLLGLLRSQKTRKAVAAWPCCCAWAVPSHVVWSSHNACKFNVEEQQLRGAKHTTSASSRGSACDSGNNYQQGGGYTSKEEERDKKVFLVWQSYSGEKFASDSGGQIAGCTERVSLSRHLRQRLCIVVLDEADMLLGHFFRRQTKKLLSAFLHPRLQLLATSATFPPPYIDFLEQLCISLDSEKERELRQHTTLHEPECYTKKCCTGQPHRMHERTIHHSASKSVKPLVAAVAFIREHASAAAAADVRSAAVEAYLSTLVERPASVRSASQDEVAEGALDFSSSKKMSKAEVDHPGAKTWLDADKPSASSAKGNRAVQAVDSILDQPFPHTLEKPHIFEKVMLCSSFLVHEADNRFKICGRGDTALPGWPTLGDLGQNQLQKSYTADEEGSLFTSYVSKRRDDVCPNVESTPGEASLVAASAVDANGSRLTTISDSFPSDVTPEHLDVTETYLSRTACKKRRKESPSLTGIKYVIMTVEDEPSLMRQLGAKVRALQEIFANLVFRQAMIFCNEAEPGAQIAACLINLGIPTLYTSSKLTQERRVRNLLALKRIDCRVFVCSDVMCRGIDASAVDLVINLDVPRDRDIFLHRSGRAGRFGGNGVCVCVASKAEQPYFEYLATSLKLAVVPSLESLSGLQQERMLQRDGGAEEIMGDTNQENLFCRRTHRHSDLQSTRNTEARQDVCAELSQPAGFKEEQVVEGQDFHCDHARKPALFADPDRSTIALEQRNVTSLPGFERNQAIKRRCSGDAAMHARGDVSYAGSDGYQGRDAPSVNARAGPDLFGCRQPGESSSYLHALLLAFFTEARRRRKTYRVCNDPSTQRKAERFVAGVHRGICMGGFRCLDRPAQELIDRCEAGPAASLQDTVCKTVAPLFQIPFRREDYTITASSSVLASNPYSSTLSSRDVMQREGSGYVCVKWIASLRDNKSVLLQPYEHMRQQRWQDAAFLSRNTSIFSSLAATAMCAYDRAFCDNAACPPASMVISDGNSNDAHCESRIVANPRVLRLTQATAFYDELANMERRIIRTSEVRNSSCRRERVETSWQVRDKCDFGPFWGDTAVGFTSDQRRSEPKTCGDSFQILLFVHGNAFKEHVQKLKKRKRRRFRQRRRDQGSTQLASIRRDNATVLGYTLLHLKQTHAQFWGNAEA